MEFKPRKYRMIKFPDEFVPDENQAFMNTITEYAEKSNLPILIDCSEINLIYSAGLGLLINGYKICNEKKVFYGVVNVNDAIMHLIEITKLDNVLPYFPTVEEFEILELNDEQVGTKVPPLEFSYEEKVTKGKTVYICKGIMCEGQVLSKLFESLENLKEVIFDFSDLSFMDADCLDMFSDLCETSKLYLFGVNEIVDDELRLFELKDKVTIGASLKEILKESDSPS